jgi:hypothetical protein
VKLHSNPWPALPFNVPAEQLKREKLREHRKKGYPK